MYNSVVGLQNQTIALVFSIVTLIENQV